MCVYVYVTVLACSVCVCVVRGGSGGYSDTSRPAPATLYVGPIWAAGGRQCVAPGVVRGVQKNPKALEKGIELARKLHEMRPGQSAKRL